MHNCLFMKISFLKSGENCIITDKPRFTFLNQYFSSVQFKNIYNIIYNNKRGNL